MRACYIWTFNKTTKSHTWCSYVNKDSAFFIYFKVTGEVIHYLIQIINEIVKNVGILSFNTFDIKVQEKRNFCQVSLHM